MRTHDHKGRDQVITELAYYRRILSTTGSGDRRQRAERSILNLERRLLKLDGVCPACNGTGKVAPQL